MVEYSGSTPMTDTKGYLTPTQVKSIIGATKSYKYKLIFYLISRTGRRVSEVVRCLKPNDIDFENNLINFTILKRKRPVKELKAVSPKLIKVLKRYIKNEGIKPDSYIFPISRQRVDTVLKKVADGVGLGSIGKKRIHIHILRHSFAIEGAKKAESPADLVQLKDMLGHARIDTTMFYLKFNPQDQRKLLDKMWKE